LYFILINKNVTNICLGLQKTFSYIPLHAKPERDATEDELNNLVQVYDWTSEHFHTHVSAEVLD